MLISHEHEFIFVHIPRTGGTSIEKSLALATGMTDWKLQNGTPQEHLDADDLMAFTQDATSHMRGMKHATARTLRDHVGEDVWNRYFKFAVVRNPLDRTLSVFLKTLKSPRYDLVRPLARSKLAFNASLQLKYQVLNKQPDLQADFLCDEGRLIVDDIIRFEDLTGGYRRIAERIGLDPTLSNNNDATHHRPYASYYTPATRRLIERVKEPDFRLLDYPTT